MNGFCVSVQCCWHGWTAPVWGGPPEFKIYSPPASCWPWPSSSSWASCRSARVSFLPPCVRRRGLVTQTHTRPRSAGTSSAVPDCMTGLHAAATRVSKLLGSFRLKLTWLMSAGLEGATVQTWARASYFRGPQRWGLETTKQTLQSSKPLEEHEQFGG